MFTLKIRDGLLLGVASAIPFTLWSLVVNARYVPEQGDWGWLIQGTLALWLLFTLVGCWNAMGATVLLSLAAAVPGLPRFIRYAAAFLGALVAAGVGNFLVECLRPSLVPGVSLEALVMALTSALILAVGFYYRDQRSLGVR